MSNTEWIPHEYKRIAVINDCNVYSDDIKTLKKGQWLNDNLITFVLEVIFDELDSSRQDEIHLVHATMCELLKYEKDDSSFKEYFPSIELAEKNIIIFVLNDNQDAEKVLGGNHWALLFFDRRKNEFVYLDSLISLNQGTLVYAQHIYTLFTTNNYLKTDRKPELTPGRCAKQKNSYDCGMFIIEFSKIIMKTIVQEDQMFKQISPEDMIAGRNFWLNKLQELYKIQNPPSD